MNELWFDIKAWFAKKGGFTHVVAGGVGVLVLGYASVPAFHTLVVNAYAVLPAWAEQTAAAALGLYMWYRNPNK